MNRYLYLTAGFLLSLCVACSEQAEIATPPASLPDGPQLPRAVANANRPDNIELTQQGSFKFGTCEATIIDTRLFENPIVKDKQFEGEPVSTSIFRPRKNGQPIVEAGVANDLVPGSIMNEPRGIAESNFPGISATGWNPPDPALAVGPNHIVETVNQSLAFYTKEGVLQFQQRLNDTNQPGFFDDVNAGNFVFDPKCFYDPYIDRFIVLALEVYQDIDESYITFAISDDDDPNGIWYRYRTFSVVDVGNASYWVDYPGLGFDENGFYVTGNLFFLNGFGNGFGGVLFRSFDKTPLLNGDTATFTDIRDENAASVQIAQHFGGDNPAPYFISRQTGNSLRITALNNALTNPSFSSELVSVPDASAPADVPNGAGNQQLLNTLDGRLMNVHWRNGSLWTCHGIAKDGGGAIARWYEISTGGFPNAGSPSLVQSGNVDGGPGVSTFFPAIYTDAQGNAAMVVAQSSASEFASVQATGRLSGDPAGSMGELTELVAGSSATSGRWGDYFDIAIDPNDDLTFWMVGEYETGSGWRTSLDSFRLFVIGDVNGDGVVNLLDIDPFVELISTGQFDAAADINGDGFVNLLDVQGFIELLSDG